MSTKASLVGTILADLASLASASRRGSGTATSPIFADAGVTRTSEEFPQFVYGLLAGAAVLRCHIFGQSGGVLFHLFRRCFIKACSEYLCAFLSNASIIPASASPAP